MDKDNAAPGGVRAPTRRGLAPRDPNKEPTQRLLAEKVSQSSYHSVYAVHLVWHRATGDTSFLKFRSSKYLNACIRLLFCSGY